jgi:hypothetical protein
MSGIFKNWVKVYMGITHSISRHPEVCPAAAAPSWFTKTALPCPETSFLARPPASL